MSVIHAAQVTFLLEDRNNGWVASNVQLTLVYEKYHYVGSPGKCFPRFFSPSFIVVMSRSQSILYVLGKRVPGTLDAYGMLSSNRLSVKNSIFVI